MIFVIPSKSIIADRLRIVFCSLEYAFNPSGLQHCSSRICRVHLQTWLEGRRFQVRSTDISHGYPRHSHDALLVDLVCRILVPNLDRWLDRFLYVPRVEAVQDGITTVRRTVECFNCYSRWFVPVLILSSKRFSCMLSTRASSLRTSGEHPPLPRIYRSHTFNTSAEWASCLASSSCVFPSCPVLLI